MKTLGFALIASLCLAAPAMAESDPISATLAQPVSAQTEVIAGSTIFRCAEAVCTSISRPLDPNSVGYCHDLEHKVGKLTAYGTERKPFDADKLTRCNASD